MKHHLAEHAFRLPVPEKAQKQAMLILLPLDGNSTRQLPPMPDGSRPEPAVFTIADNPKGQVGARIVDEKLKNDPNVKDDLANGRPLEAMLKRWIGAHSPENEGLIEPNEKEFASAIPEAHRKGEKAYHVRAFRGTKDGESRGPFSISRTLPLLSTRRPLDSSRYSRHSS